MNLALAFAKFMFKTFGMGTKIRVLRQIQRTNEANISIPAALDMLYDRYSKGGKKPSNGNAIMIDQWRKGVNSGRGLSNAMSGWVSPSEEMIINAGEQSDKLSRAMSDALEATKAGRTIRKTIRNATIYPLVLLTALIVMFYGFSYKIVPIYAEIVDPSVWTGAAATMYTVSNFIVRWLPTIVGILLVSAVLIYFSLSRLHGPLRTYLDKIPPYSTYKVIVGASFMMALRGFISADIAIPNALRRIARMSNPYVRSRVRAILAQVDAGKNLGDAMSLTGHNFPDPDINDEISIYSGIDTFSENLDVLAKEWIEGAVEKAQASARLFTTISMVLTFLTAGFIFASMLELNDILTRSTGLPTG